MFTDLDMDKLNDKYLSYPLLVDEDIRNSVKEFTGLVAEHPYLVAGIICTVIQGRTYP